MPISLKANSDGSAEILNGAVTAIKINTNNSVQANTIHTGTSVTASGTAVDFVGIPEGVKRITVMFDGVSTNGTSLIQLQIGDQSFSNSEYRSTSANVYGTNVCQVNASNFGFVIGGSNPTCLKKGVIMITNIKDKAWVSNHTISDTDGGQYGGGTKTLSGTLDRVRITTVNGTDQFDAGTINISWEF